MGHRNCFFSLACEGKSKEPGLRPNTNKLVRFNVVVPWFKTHKIWFPEECANDPTMIEAKDELTKAAKGKFKSKHDDFIDTISMLGSLKAWKPDQVTPAPDESDIYWDDLRPQETTATDRYVV